MSYTPSPSYPAGVVVGGGGVGGVGGVGGGGGGDGGDGDDDVGDGLFPASVGQQQRRWLPGLTYEELVDTWRKDLDQQQQQQQQQQQKRRQESSFLVVAASVPAAAASAVTSAVVGVARTALWRGGARHELVF